MERGTRQRTKKLNVQIVIISTYIHFTIACMPICFLWMGFAGGLRAGLLCLWLHHITYSLTPMLQHWFVCWENIHCLSYVCSNARIRRLQWVSFCRMQSSMFFRSTSQKTPNILTDAFFCNRSVLMEHLYRDSGGCLSKSSKFIRWSMSLNTQWESLQYILWENVIWMRLKLSGAVFIVIVKSTISSSCWNVSQCLLCNSSIPCPIYFGISVWLVCHSTSTRAWVQVCLSARPSTSC